MDKKTYGWRETEMEGTYKGYKSAECIMAGVHDFTCYLKRGFGRATTQASVDVRNGLLSREEGFELAKRYDREIPQALAYYLEQTGITEDEFYRIMNEKKVKELEGVKVHIVKKKKTNAEILIPFVEQIIQKHLGEPDPRETKHKDSKK